MKSIKTLFVSGLSNSKFVEVVGFENNIPKIILAGSANIFQNIDDKRIDKSYIRLDLSNTQKINLANTDIIFNQIADADSHSKVLDKFERILKNHKIKVINHPRYVKETSRNLIYSKLSNIDNLKIPKTIKFVPLNPDDIDNAIKKHLFTFPIILRKIGTHGGETVKLLHNFDDTKKLYDVALDGSAFYLIQYIDYKEENIYKKFRIVVVNGEIYIRHVIFNDNWMIHSRSREFMQNNPSFVKKEEEIISNFEKDIKIKIQETIAEIYRKIKLDYFGIDCCIDKDFNILIFELNANMNILINTSDNPIFSEQIKKIKLAIEMMIFNKSKE